MATDDRPEGQAAPLPLEGITVIALEQAVAAPLASRHLADLGARVIKVERTGEGDFARRYDDAVLGLGSHFVWLNRGKESVEIDLGVPRGRQFLLDLLDMADVFVQNLAPGAADRLGLGADELSTRFPRLVIAGISGYGRGGPLSDRKAYDMLVQAEAGLISINGTSAHPAKTGIPTADISAGMYLAQGVLAALFRRERTGCGAVLDVAMFDATLEWLAHPLYFQMYRDEQVPRMGLSHVSIAPYDAYPTADGQILIGVQNDRGWRVLALDVFGDAELADHPDLATNQLRVLHREQCDDAVGRHTRRFATAELDAMLAAAGVPAAALNDMRRVVQHPQLAARDRWRDVATQAGPVRALLPPVVFRDVTLAMGAVPSLGEHTQALRDEVGVGRAPDPQPSLPPDS